MSWKNTEYFRKRAVTERTLAEAAKHPKAIAAHADLAERYDELVLEGNRPSLCAVIQGFAHAA